jgi:hypothetical protein
LDHPALWKGMSAYSPNHRINQLVRKPDPNGLLFEAVPKSSTCRVQMEIRLTAEARAVEATQPFSFQQFPVT